MSHHHRTTIFQPVRRLLAAAVSAVTVFTALPFSAQSVCAADVSDEKRTMPVIAVNGKFGWRGIDDNYSDAVVTVLDETGTADMTDIAANIRLRGNSSRRVPKKSYKLNFPEKANPLHLGGGKAKTWALIGNYFDASLLRNWTAYQIGAKLDGLPYTPHCRSAELYINGEYHGVYLLTEAVSVNKHRVHITEAPDLVEGNGYLIEMTRYAEEPCFWADCFQFEVKSKLSEDGETAQKQIDYIAGYTNDALRALQSGDQTAAAQYFDIPSLVDNCLLNEICKNPDVGWDSYYLAKDADGKLAFNPVWDFDIAFGNCGFPHIYTTTEGANLFALTDSVDDSNPWLCYAMRCAWFRELLKARWDEMLPVLRAIPDEILAEAETYNAAYQQNFEKLGANAIKTGDDPSVDYYTHLGQAKLLADWVSERMDWLDEYYASDDFAVGIFPDEKGNALPVTNDLAVSLLAEMYEYNECSDLSYSGYSGSGNSLASFVNLTLAAGQTYRLSFEGSAVQHAEIECQFWMGKEYSRTFSVTSEPQMCEFVFTPENTELAASLSLIATGIGTVQVSHLTLTRVNREPVAGDLNCDGICGIADVRLLLDWLVCAPDTVLDDWQAADLNGDGILNAVDLTLLKQMLVG